MTFSDLKRSSYYSKFPPELDYLPTTFRIILPNWVEDEDELGWLTVDDDDGSSRDWNDFGGVVIACVEDAEDNHDLLNADKEQQSFERSPFYCLVVERVSGNVFERVGVAAVKRMDWVVEDSVTDIVIV